MMICDSDNVVKCYNVYENRSLKIMVMEYCNGGELQREITNKYKIPEREAILILKQVINGIAVLM
jgi:serine/threonine protein kinase